MDQKKKDLVKKYLSTSRIFAPSLPPLVHTESSVLSRKASLISKRFFATNKRAPTNQIYLTPEKGNCPISKTNISHCHSKSVLEERKKLKEIARKRRLFTDDRRGYYSEVITTDNNNEVDKYHDMPWAVKKAQYIWEVETERHAPIITHLPIPYHSVNLEPAEKWIYYGIDKDIKFPLKSSRPKVQLQFVVAAGCLPRKIEVERRRREYGSQKIKKLLEDMKVNPIQLIPVEVVAEIIGDKRFSIYSKYNFLPLELFDNTDYDQITPEGWLDLGMIDNVRYPIPAEAFLPIADVFKLANTMDNPLNYAYDWMDVAVTDYNKRTGMFTLLSLDSMRSEKRVPRILLMFKAEDPKIFAERVYNALALRAEAERLIRFELYIDCMLLTGMYDLEEPVLRLIYEMATRNNHVKIFEPTFLDVLDNEIRLNHKRALCELQFRRCMQLQPEIYSFIKAPEREEKPVLEKGCITTPMEDFKGVLKHIRQQTLFVLPEIVNAITCVVGQVLKVSNMSLFTVNYGRYVPLSEFEDIQTHATNNMIKNLKVVWLEKNFLNLTMCLRDVGRGWFDITVSDWYIYVISKLYRMNELVKLRMQEALRNLVVKSINMYLNLIETPCQCCLDCDKTNFVWGDDLVTSQFKSSQQPVFSLALHMNAEGTYYSTDPSMFVPVLLTLFNRAVYETHFIKQVHPQLLTKLKFPNDLYLSSIGLKDPYVKKMRQKLIMGVVKALIPLESYADEYNKYVNLYSINVKDYVTEFYEQPELSMIEIKEEISLQYRLKKNLEACLPENIAIGPFFVSVQALKLFLVRKREELYNELLNRFAARQRTRAEEILDEYRQIMFHLIEKPRSIEHIYEIREWMETVPIIIRTQEEIVRKFMYEYDVLDSFWYTLSQEDFDAKWEAFSFPLKIDQQIDLTQDSLIEETEKYQTIQFNDEMELIERIEKFTVQVQAISGYKDESKLNEIAVDVRRLWKQMKDAQEQGQLLNQRQKLFLQPVVPFDSLSKLMKEFEPYKNLWLTASDWVRYHSIWLDNPLVNIDGDAIESQLSEMFKTMSKLVRTFNDVPACQAVAINMKKEMESFKKNVPLIQAVRNPGMKERHWEDLARMARIPVEWSPTLTFNDLLRYKIDEHSDLLVQISELAAKEFAIEEVLTKMKHEWEVTQFEIVSYKQTGTYILKISDEALQMLDDHLVMTQQISFSPFKKAFEEEINDWEEKLKLTAAVLEEWIEVQKQWMYLEPIFTSEDINRQLPIASKKFNSMERIWRRIMKTAHDLPKVMEICPDLKLLESLKDANHMLEIVEKSLADYLETKRTSFPRFFFLSDDELLEILAQAKNPLAVQPHLKKCFENIKKLTFKKDLKMTQMFSSDGECVDLIPPIYPVGNVEDWMLKVEEAMKNTIRVTLGNSLKDLAKKERKVWVLGWPGQIVIAGSQTNWTAEVTNGIETNTMKEYYEVMLQNLDSLRSLVKGTLTFLQREVISALIVIEVHARDVTELIIKEGVSDINDFVWISQLRYYWVASDDEKVRAVNAEFQYGYEYLGNSGRLVITPLTDRCYLTLTGALHLGFGGAPAGPAGTGKTETTKDLAKAFAIQCVVFNCSDQLDFMAMGKFFKGLASSGAWACFDEFNRIDIEVLSVIAQQITTIQKAQQARQERFIFEGCDIALKASCAVFITMNPGYAGRTELPDNLKALFRPVAMMVPNYTLIAEISLFSFGFSDARTLADKITTTFKLSSEQLSTQDHYDFGMRAVKTVISVAGNLKREKPDMEERQIVLRALRDVNMPKFLKDDLKLFNGIVSDLFPRMVEEPVDYGELQKGIQSSCVKLGFEDVPDFVHKVIQLYETTVVRHGLMLVGPTGSGKTKCYEILKHAMTSLEGKLAPSGYPFERVSTYVLNPKAITMGQLYGEFDIRTHEWTDGILPSLVRVGAASEEPEKHWYVFDGPVDAVWIENMNTVLDDNKKLCLTSGEIIKLTPRQTMMFEVADLAVASPATVSRCGMVYLEPSVLGLQPFVNCWMQRLPNRAKPYDKQLFYLFESYLFPALEYLRTKMREIVGSVDSALVQSFLGLMDYRLQALADNKMPPPTEAMMELVPGLLVSWVVFSLIWSVGGTCDRQSRGPFSEWLRNKMNNLNRTPTKMVAHEPMFPKKGFVYDYKLNDGGLTDNVEGELCGPTWRSWMENVEAYEIYPETKYSDIEVPTIDNVRCAVMLGILLNNEKNVLCVGPTGTGKTCTVLTKLSKHMHKKFICDFIIFSARTSANMTQDLLDARLEKRRKGVFGPPLLKRQVFFIDDFNMPALEVYGAQPPIELIRQWMDFEGWYDRKVVGEFRRIIDVNFVAAMSPPGGGRNPVTARLLRHFHYIAFTEMEDSSKVTIFGTILKSWLTRTQGLIDMLDIMVNTTLEVYTIILNELLPTPAKTHYTFNLRDLSKVFQGTLMFEPEPLADKNELLRLWYHENCRVFQDRLVNDKDREWFDNLLRSKIRSAFKMNPDVCLGDEIIMYGDFADPNVDVKLYARITDYAKLALTLKDYLDEYNQQTTKPMNLVLFMDAISHICRIARVIRQPQGNALLLGMGGSGRQSLTRLSTHIAEYSFFQIELHKSYGLTDWRDNIKSLMLKAGLLNRETVFMFSDTQIKTESFLEDLNNILNSGDVPNIYQADELDKIYIGMKGPALEQGIATTKSNLYALYQKQVRSNLHVVITMSPIGEVFRARLRQFPALVNCCTIDWFSAWPDSALESVALQFLNGIKELDVNKHVLTGIVLTCQYMHQSVIEASTRYLQELSRHNYVTPTSYLELLASYSALLGKKKGELQNGILRLKSGLDKLLSTQEEVKVLHVQLTAMKPALLIAAADAESMIKRIAADTAIAEKTKEHIGKEEEEAMKKAQLTQEIKEDAQRDLDEALPTLKAAEESLKSLNKNDIVEVRSMKRPPPGVVYVMETICIIKDMKPIVKTGQKPDYWEAAKILLTDSGKFLQDLMNFDKESITKDMIEKLTPYVSDPQFMPAKIQRISKACTSLCMWVHAMYKYYFINMSVAPKKEALAQAQADLEETQRLLEIAKEHMRTILEGLAVLNEKLQAKMDEKAEKEQGIHLCESRMSRALRLVEGLADERVRWMETTKMLEVSIVNVIGDILISSGAVAYISPFTDKYREGLLSEWTIKLNEYDVPHSKDKELVDVLGDPVVIRQWQLDGLPRDFLSTENAILVEHSRRWPLFVDPQGQANKWVKNMGKAMGLLICKLNDKDLLRTIESGIRFGKACLIENVETDLDPALDPVLQRQVFRQGGQNVLKLGEVIVPYNDDFRLYITTKLPNPHYTPEISIKVLIVNFTLSPGGMQDQMLSLVVMQERPDLEEARSTLIVNNAQMKMELKEIEDRILFKLSSSTGSPVDDVDLITTLEASKVKSEDIKARVEESEVTKQDIDVTRSLYIPVANRSQILFFCLSDLSNIDPMYQYSLEWFTGIFLSSIAAAKKSSEIDQRIKDINETFTFNLYSNVCRSLFEKHKLHFAFLLCARIFLDSKFIDAHEWQCFIVGGTSTEQIPHPNFAWMDSRSWQEIVGLYSLPAFQSFVENFKKHEKTYKHIFDSPTPHKERLPQPWETDLNDFQKMMVMKCIRPDCIIQMIQDYICTFMGAHFIEPQTSSLAAMYKESSARTPLIFVLSTGTDPANDLYKFADRMRMAKRMLSISLGQGQGPRAEKMIQSAVDTGAWLFFQNCHLAPSWMPRLEYLIENIPDTCHKDFRLWLTSTPSPYFPISILQNGSKMTVEPPRGIKANMLRAYFNQVVEFQELFTTNEPKVPIFKWLLFSLCLFHGVCLERRKFGPLGFNIPYEFTDGDLRICISQLHMFLFAYADIPFKVLTYTAGHINYGGRVTDDWDRRCLLNLLSDYYKTGVLSNEYAFDDAAEYHQLPEDKNYSDYLDYIRKLPLNDNPEMFGLHQNADISRARAETQNCLNTLLALQPKSVGTEASSQEEVTTNLANSILSFIPSILDFESISEKYPVLYEESLNTVLVQEVIRYNRLLVLIDRTLKDLLKAVKGLVVMSAALENMSICLYTNIVPSIWSSKAYPSLKPLGAWVTDLKERLNFLMKWVDDGIPSSFWISGFYFPQAFLTGILQNFARKYIVSIDTINFAFQVLESRPEEKPEDGCCIYGLFLEGARWNKNIKSLDESKPKELYIEMPTIWLRPEEFHKQAHGIYECPVYKTLTRAGTLSTTGHSTNYVLAIEIPSKKPQTHWIKRGCALICALDY